MDLKLIMYLILSAQSHNLDPALVLAVAKTESNLRHDVVGALGELGPLQLRPEFHFYPVNGTVEQKVEASVTALKKQLTNCKQRTLIEKTICHNLGLAGGSRVKYPLLHPYVKKVKAYFDFFSKKEKK